MIDTDQISETSKINSLSIVEPKNKHSLKSYEMPCDLRLTKKDCETALCDLRQDSVFQPAGDIDGPYDIDLDIKDNKLIFYIKNSNKKDLPTLILSLSPYRSLIKDYFIIIRSYCDAASEGKQCKLEAIDMGRRGIHNEGAELLKERLKGKIILDTNTARRLFTLICSLQRCKTQPIF